MPFSPPPITTGSLPTGIPASNVADGSVNDAEFEHLDGVSGDIQDQLDLKLAIDGNGSALTALNASAIASGTLAEARLPTGIDSAKIADGTISNTEFQRLNGISDNVQTQLDTKLASNGDGSGLTALNGSNITTGTVAEARLPTAIDAAKIANGSVSNAEFQRLNGVSDDIQTQLDGKQPLDADLTAYAALSSTGFIARTGAGTVAARTLSSGTGTTVSNGDGSGNPAVNVTYGSSANTAVQGNDTRIPPTPSGAGKFLYDNGSGYVAGTAGTSSQLLHGGATPSFGAVALGSEVSGQLGVANGGSGASSLAAFGVVVGNGTSAVHVTGTGSTGQVLTSNGASANPTFQAPIISTRGAATLPSTYSVTASYAATGLAVNLPGAGTYRIKAEMRQVVVVSAAPSGFITTKFRNSTTSADVTSSERLGVVAPIINLGFTTTVAVSEDVTVTGADTIQLWAIRGTGPTYTTCDIVSDSDGRTRMWYERVA